MANKTLDLIYERWIASLYDRDKSHGFVESNFAELFDQLAAAGATFDEAHAYLTGATKAHQASPSLIKSTWKRIKGNPKNADMTEKEFGDNWNKDIASKATNSFYHIYPLPEEKDEDKEPKVYGNMSAKEYKLQRRHADSFPVLDTEELEKKLQQLGDFDPTNDIFAEDDSGG